MKRGASAALVCAGLLALAALGACSDNGSITAAEATTTEDDTTNGTDGIPGGTSGGGTGDAALDGEEAFDDVAFYLENGFTAAEAACLDATPLNADVIAEPTFGDDVPIAVHFEGANAPVIIRGGSLPVVEVERQILEALARDCAPAEKLDALAAVEAAAQESEIFDHLLPQHLAARRADGATPEELDCLKFGFRAAPARLGTVAAYPLAVEQGCADDARRAEWRRAALLRGFDAAGVDGDRSSCLVGDPAGLDLLEVLVAAIAAGEDPSVTSAAMPEPSCAPASELVALAETLVERDVDFGVERLGTT